MANCLISWCLVREMVPRGGHTPDRERDRDPSDSPDLPGECVSGAAAVPHFEPRAERANPRARRGWQAPALPFHLPLRS